MTPEGKVTKEIKEGLNAIRQSGAPVWFVKIAGNGRQQTGLPDFHITYKGRSIWLEVKRSGWKPPARVTHQGVVLDKIRKSGAVAEYVTSFSEVLSLLKQLDNEEKPT